MYCKMNNVINIRMLNIKYFLRIEGYLPDDL